VTETKGQLTAGTPEPLINSEYAEQTPMFSPDGRWIAYSTNRSGQQEVYVRAFPRPASGQVREWPISNDGGARPHWSLDGRLLYQSGEQILSVRYTVDGDTFIPAPGKPQVRVEKLGGQDWDLAPDGRIAVVTPVDTAETTPPESTFVFLLNFSDHLRRQTPSQ
jgi:Tol biopolymer transport system component